jgi:hypothetical protein
MNMSMWIVVFSKAFGLLNLLASFFLPMSKTNMSFLRNLNLFVLQQSAA